MKWSRTLWQRLSTFASSPAPQLPQSTDPLVATSVTHSSTLLSSLAPLMPLMIDPDDPLLTTPELRMPLRHEEHTSNVQITNNPQIKSFEPTWQDQIGNKDAFRLRTRTQEQNGKEFYTPGVAWFQHQRQQKRHHTQAKNIEKKYTFSKDTNYRVETVRADKQCRVHPPQYEQVISSTFWTEI